MLFVRAWLLWIVLTLLVFIFQSTVAQTIQIDPPQTDELEAYVTIEGQLDPSPGTRQVDLQWLVFGNSTDSTLSQKILEHSVSINSGKPTALSISSEEVAAQGKNDPTQLDVQNFTVDYSGTGSITYQSRIRLAVQTRFPPIEIGVQPPDSLKTKSALIESDAPEIRHISNQIDNGSNDIETIQNVDSWVYQNLTYEGAYIGTPQSALQTWEEKKGTCNGYANLAAAILRQKGFPVRMVIGLANDRSTWREHAWLEVLTRQGWIATDPTYNETLADATHFSLARGADFTEISDKIQFAQGQPVKLFRKFTVFVQAASRYSSAQKIAMTARLVTLDEKNARLELGLTNKGSQFIPVDIVYRVMPGVSIGIAGQSLVLIPLGTRQLSWPVTKTNPGDWGEQAVRISTNQTGDMAVDLIQSADFVPPFEVLHETKKNQMEIILTENANRNQNLRVTAKQNSDYFLVNEIQLPARTTQTMDIELVRPSLEPIQITISSPDHSVDFWAYPVLAPNKTDWLTNFFQWIDRTARQLFSNTA